MYGPALPPSRQGLAYAQNRGPLLDNDVENENSLRPTRLAIGSTKLVPGDPELDTPRGVKFLSVRFLEIIITCTYGAGI
jgi:hypothetical protein